jgi:uncharacterized protein (TIGR00369 family)
MKAGIMPVMTAGELEELLAREFPQIGHMKMRVELVDAQRIRMRLPVDNSHLRPGGTVSGPTLMTLADCALYLLILAQLGPVTLAVTTSLNINFLRKPEPADIIAEARLLKLGQRLAVGEVGLFSAGMDDPVAHATVTYSIPPKRIRRNAREKPRTDRK